MGGIENFPPLWFASSFFLLFLKVSFDLLECLAFGFRHCTKNERDGGIPSHTHVRKKKMSRESLISFLIYSPILYMHSQHKTPMIPNPVNVQGCPIAA